MRIPRSTFRMRCMEWNQTGLQTKIWRVPSPRRNGNASQRHIKKGQGKRVAVMQWAARADQRAAASAVRTIASPARARSSSVSPGRRRWTCARRTLGTWMNAASRRAPAPAASAARQHK